MRHPSSQPQVRSRPVNRLSIFPPLAAASAALLVTTAPARASDWVDARFQGTVTQVNSDAPAGIAVGTPIYWSVVFDKDTLTDYTASVNDVTGLGFDSVMAATLAHNDYASLSVSVGPISFTKYDQQGYGTPAGDTGNGNLGIGDFPTVIYLNGSFSGVGNILVNNSGYSIDADPIADAFGGFDLGSGQGGSDFALSKVSYNADGSVADPFADTFAVGNYDAAAVVFTSAAPEPAIWTLMIAGVAVTGVALSSRRNRRRAIAGAT